MYKPFGVVYIQINQCVFIEGFWENIGNAFDL